MRSLDPFDYRRNVLTPALSGGVLPDLFVRYLLDIDDCDESADENAIGEQLAAIKSFWDKEEDNGKYRDVIGRLKAEHSTSKLTLGDVRARAEEAAKIVAQREADDRSRQKQTDDFEKQVGEIVKRNGGLTPRDRRILSEVARGMELSEDYVEKYLDGCPPLEVESSASPLPDSTRRKIRDELKSYAELHSRPRDGASLFHFLGFNGPDVGQDLLRDRWTELQEKNRKLRPDYEKELTDRLLANVRTYLLDGDIMVYLATLTADVAENLSPRVAAAAVDDGVIDEAETEQLVNMAQEWGLPSAEARDLVRRIAHDLELQVVLGGVAEYVSCGQCNHPHLKEGAPQRCRKCGAHLFRKCPACAKTNPASSAACGNCGRDLAADAAARKTLEHAQVALDRGRPREAKNAVESARSQLEGQSAFEQLLASVDGAMASAAASWKVVATELGERRFNAAASALRVLAQEASDVPGPDGELPSDKLASAQRQLDEVRKLVADSRRLDDDQREAVLARALATVADSSEAARELATIKPMPSSDVSAAASNRSMAIDWQPTSSPGEISYRIMRADDTAGSLSTATEVGTTTETSFSDPSAEVGAIVRYAVICERAGAASAPAWSEPSVVARGVQQLMAVEGDGMLELRWDHVGSVGRVDVIRRDVESGETAELAAESTGLVDQKLVNGRRYEYAVSVSYPGAGAERVSTPGQTVVGTPAARPLPVEDLIAEGGGNIVELRYSRPAAGSVQVYRCSEDPGVVPGEDLRIEEFAALGEAIAPTAGGAEDRAPASLAWYLPVTVAGGYAVAGVAVRHAAISPIENVQAVDYQSSVRVTWSWPDDVRAAVAVWRRDREPTAVDDEKANRIETTVAQYDENGGLEIAAEGPAPIFVAVFPSVRIRGEFITGTTAGRGARASVARKQKVDVRYQLRRAGLRGKQLHLSIVEPVDQRLPELLVVARRGDILPRAVDDGDVVAQLGGDSGSVEHQLDLGKLGRPIALRMFTAISSAGTTHRLHDPDSSELIFP